MARVDLHTHTAFSHDATTPPEVLVERALEAGLDRIAVTDHATIEGALRARELAPELVIVGEEIRCRCRTELIGLFLTERIPPRLSIDETADRIRAQGGLVYAPHPYAYAREPLRRARRALGVADIVEGINARAFLPLWNRAATRAARRLGLPMAAGSDAHLPFEIGRAYAEMPAFDGAEGLRASAHASRTVQTRVSHPVLHVVGLALAGRSALEKLAAHPIAPGRQAELTATSTGG
ncbi:MAG: PHP-associated domain-containing protein [Gemmatimonadota bacterium]|nr:PHP-associated domain-containing protein [Gemmatimonadota bacterium]